jgi:hypothetical protein
VHPGRYRVEVDPLPGNSYISEVKLDSAIVEEALDLSDGVHGSKLKVTVSPDGGELSGVVQSEAPASVFLDPGHSVKTAPDGTYIIHGIRPGKYGLYAVEGTQNPDPIPIEIKAGDRITQNLHADAK